LKSATIGESSTPQVTTPKQQAIFTSSSPPSSSRRASSIAEAMDPEATGYILWEQFLAYIRWQETVFGVKTAEEDKTGEGKSMVHSPTRRGSMQQKINTSRVRVRARIELRHIFNSLIDGGGTHRVSCRELELAIRFSPKCRELFTPSLLAKKLEDILKDDIHMTSYQRYQLSARKY
jgi:hypothetical protein